MESTTTSINKQLNSTYSHNSIDYHQQQQIQKQTSQNLPHTNHVNLIHPFPSAGLKELPAQFERCEIEDLIELIGQMITHPANVSLFFKKIFKKPKYILSLTFNSAWANNLPKKNTASMLTRLINHNDQIPFTSTSLTRFHSRSPPTISINDYLRRIYKYTNPEPICLILILNYIDRICKNLINFTICSLTVHRFCITSVTIGSKFICDSFYSNSRYAKVGGISLTEINLLEREFLLAIDYRLSTTNEELNKYYLSLVESHPSYKIDRSTATLTTSYHHQSIISNQSLQSSSGTEERASEGDKVDQEQQEKTDERESKRIKAKDPFGDLMASDPNQHVNREEPPESSDHYHLHHLLASTSNILPDSIVED